MQDHPIIQERAKSELNEVVGPGRLPSFEDRTNLPYINALCKELLRHNCPAPAGMQLVYQFFHVSLRSGLPHKSTKEDVHDGYCLPKGTITFPSIWYVRVAAHENDQAHQPLSISGKCRAIQAYIRVLNCLILLVS